MIVASPDTETLRADLDSRLGIDLPMCQFLIEKGFNNSEVREYIERRIAAGNNSARIQKEIMIDTGTWYDEVYR